MTRLRHRVAAATATSVSIAAIAAGCGSGDDVTAPAAPSSTPAPTTARPSAGSSRYRDGDYEAKGWYGGLPSNIDVALTLRDDRITEVQVTANATDPTSLDYQQRFADAVPDVVVGRPIDEVRVSRLAGSSGTPDGSTRRSRRSRTRPRGDLRRGIVRLRRDRHALGDRDRSAAQRRPARPDL